jgi:hypothetical protein
MAQVAPASCPSCQTVALMPRSTAPTGIYWLCVQCGHSWDEETPSGNPDRAQPRVVPQTRSRNSSGGGIGFTWGPTLRARFGHGGQPHGLPGVRALFRVCPAGALLLGPPGGPILLHPLADGLSLGGAHATPSQSVKDCASFLSPRRRSGCRSSLPSACSASESRSVHMSPQ